RPDRREQRVHTGGVEGQEPGDEGRDDSRGGRVGRDGQTPVDVTVAFAIAAFCVSLCELCVYVVSCLPKPLNTKTQSSLRAPQRKRSPQSYEYPANRYSSGLPSR